MPGTEKTGPKESAGSKIAWAAITGVASASAVWFAISFGNLVTADKVASAFADHANAKAALVDGIGTWAKTNQKELRALLADDPRFRGPKGDRGPRGPKGEDGISAPLGSIAAWPVAAKPPINWRICNGDVLQAEQYPEIAKLLDTTYGSEGLDKVKLPDFRGMFLRGTDGHGVHRGAKLGVAQPQSIQRHVHAGVLQNSSNTSENYRQIKAATTQVGASSQDAVGGNMEQTTAPFGGDETRPANYAVHWIIRVK